MYQHLACSHSEEFHIKTDKGGITDIEFIAQYLVLAYAPQYPALTKWSDNVRIFEAMADEAITQSAVLNFNVSEQLKMLTPNYATVFTT